MHRGIGVTTLSIALSNYLSNMKFSSVAYLEVNSTNEIHNLAKSSKNEFKYLGIHFFSDVTLDTLPKILQMDFDYYILDFGVTNHYTNLEYLRCDTRFAICDFSLWQHNNLLAFMDSLNTNTREGVTFLGNPGTINPQLAVQKVNGYRIMRIPFIENPFQLTSQYFEFLKKISGRN